MKTVEALSWLASVVSVRVVFVTFAVVVLVRREELGALADRNPTWPLIAEALLYAILVAGLWPTPRLWQRLRVRLSPTYRFRLMEERALHVAHLIQETRDGLGRVSLTLHEAAEIHAFCQDLYDLGVRKLPRSSDGDGMFRMAAEIHLWMRRGDLAGARRRDWADRDASGRDSDV